MEQTGDTFKNEIKKAERENKEIDIREVNFMPMTVKQATGCGNDQNVTLLAFARIGKVADFDDLSGHSFQLMNEFLLANIRPEQFFDQKSLIADKPQALPAFLLPNAGQSGAGRGPTFALAFTRRWADRLRPEGANDNNGTLIVIAIRHRVAHNEFTMQLRCNDEVLSFGGLSQFQYTTTADEEVLNLALVINISDTELTQALRGTRSTNKVQPGRDFISLVADCKWKCYATNSSATLDACSVWADLPPSVENMPIPFTVGALSANWKTLLAWGFTRDPEIGPITVGFEFEDATVQYKDVKIVNAHHHVAKVNGLETEKAGLIVGADVPSGETGGYTDLEVKSIPFDLFADDRISGFMVMYKKLYENLSVIEGLEVSEKAGQAVQPQVTVSVPFGQVASFIKNAPLIWPLEEKALLTLMSNKSPDFKDIDTKDKDVVCEMCEFLTFYLARVWMNVACPKYGSDYKLTKLDLKNNRLDLGYKMVHSLYVKDVNRNNVKINGVVDLYYHLRERMIKKSQELPVVLGQILNTAACAFLEQAFADPEVTENKTYNYSVLPVLDFTTKYMQYLEDQAVKIRKQQDKYVRGEFNFTMDLKFESPRLNKLKITPWFSSLIATGENLIKPVKNQDHCTYFEERRLAGFLTTSKYGYSQIPSKKMIVRLLRQLKTELDKKPATDAAMDLWIKAALVMVKYYRRLYEKAI